MPISGEKVTITTSDSVPQFGWRYCQLETRTCFENDTLWGLIAEVKKHRGYRGIDATRTTDDVLEQICTDIGPNGCKAPEGYQFIKDNSNGLTSTVIEAAMRATIAFAEGGGKLVDPSVAKARAEVCKGCRYNTPTRGCSCSLIYQTINKLLPADKKDTSLGVCRACGCSLQLKVWMPDEVVRESNSPVGDNFPSWCWQKNL